MTFRLIGVPTQRNSIVANPFAAKTGEQFDLAVPKFFALPSSERTSVATCARMVPNCPVNLCGTWQRCGLAVVSPVLRQRPRTLETEETLTNSI